VEHQDRIALIVGKISERLVEQVYVRKKRTGFQDEIADCGTRTARPQRCGGALHRYRRVSRHILIDAQRRSRCCESKTTPRRCSSGRGGRAQRLPTL
jgi:hypothetical protein